MFCRVDCGILELRNQHPERAMKRILVSVMLSVIAVGHALAADLPQAMPPQAPAAYIPTVVPVYNWGGIYFGVNGGYAFGQTKWTNNGFVPNTSGNFSATGFVVCPPLGAYFQH